MNSFGVIVAVTSLARPPLRKGRQRGGRRPEGGQRDPGAGGGAEGRAGAREADPEGGRPTNTLGRHLRRSEPDAAGERRNSHPVSATSTPGA